MYINCIPFFLSETLESMASGETNEGFSSPNCNYYTIQPDKTTFSDLSNFSDNFYEESQPYPLTNEEPLIAVPPGIVFSQKKNTTPDKLQLNNEAIPMELPQSSLPYSPFLDSISVNHSYENVSEDKTAQKKSYDDHLASYYCENPYDSPSSTVVRSSESFNYDTYLPTGGLMKTEIMSPTSLGENSFTDLSSSFTREIMKSTTFNSGCTVTIERTPEAKPLTKEIGVTTAHLDSLFNTLKSEYSENSNFDIQVGQVTGSGIPSDDEIDDFNWDKLL